MLPSGPRLSGLLRIHPDFTRLQHWHEFLLHGHLAVDLMVLVNVYGTGPDEHPLLKKWNLPIQEYFMQR
jgi:hypothetical protein